MIYLVALLICLGMLHLTNLSTTIYMHRGLSHKGIRFGRVADFFFRLWLWLAIGVSRHEWVAVHRKHHRFTDVEGDPHSPYLHGGVWRLLFTNVLHYRNETKNAETVARYTKDIPRDWLDRWVFERGIVGPAITIGVLWLALGFLPAMLAFWLHAALYILLSGAINSVCHWFGYRNWDNTATNVRWIAWITAGEGLHNNHHQYPAAPRLSMARGEFDPAWLPIRILVALGQAELRGETRESPERGTFTETPSLVLRDQEKTVA